MVVALRRSFLYRYEEKHRYRVVAGVDLLQLKGKVQRYLDRGREQPDLIGPR